MPIVVVRTMEPRAKPRWLRIRDEGQCPRGGGLDLLPLAAYGADLETQVLWAQEDFVTVETEEDVGRVFPGLVWCSGRASTKMRVTYRRLAHRERWRLQDGGLRTGRGRRLWRR